MIIMAGIQTTIASGFQPTAAAQMPSASVVNVVSKPKDSAAGSISEYFSKALVGLVVGGVVFTLL